MRKIKFRGKGKDGKYYYGDLIHYKNGRVEIYTEIDAQVVEPESVEQFVGYDADGNEIYEGDICRCEELGECFVVLSGYSVPGYLPLNSKEIEWHLKE